MPHGNITLKRGDEGFRVFILAPPQAVLPYGTSHAVHRDDESTRLVQ